MSTDKSAKPVEAGDIWSKNGKHYRVKSVTTEGRKPFNKPYAAIEPVRYNHDQWNFDLRRVHHSMHLKYFTTMVSTMKLVERNAVYNMNYKCKPTCYCWKARKAA